MVNSQWLEKEEKELDAFRRLKRKQFPLLVIGAIVICALFGVLAVRNGQANPEINMTTSQILTPVIGMTVLVLAILAFANRANFKSGNAGLREELEKILQASEDVLYFDSEVEATPVWTVPQPKRDALAITEHFVMQITGKIPLKSYSFAKLVDIKSTKTIKMYRRYYINLCGDNKKVLTSITLNSRKNYNAFLEALKTAVPNVDIGGGK